ncbi:unnamed protein product [[Candida] boidinii]|nr:unnamed protein product [[Candida] boidinii]
MAELKQDTTSDNSTSTRDSKFVFNLKILDMLRRFSGFQIINVTESNNQNITNGESNGTENNNHDDEEEDEEDPYSLPSLNFYEYLSASYINHTEDPFISNYINYLELFYETCKNFEFSSNDLTLIDSDFLNMIYRNLKVRTKDEDSLNYLKFKVLLILNEQYMVAYYSSLSNKNKKNQENNSNQGKPIENKVFNTMIFKDNFNVFAETLILNFNRETDHILKILMLKVLYLIFTTSKTCQWVYLNDLKVLIDIFIRELFNLSARRDESLINTYLRVLCPMLIFTNLKDEDYKLDSIKEVLNYLNNFENSSNMTKKLSLKCLKLDLFNKLENQIKNSKSKNGSKNNNNNGNSNNESITNSDKSNVPFQTPNNSTTNILTNSISRTGSASTISTLNSTSSNNSRLPPPPPPPRSNSSANFNSSKNNSNNNSEQSSVESSRSASVSSASAVPSFNSNSTAASTATTTNTRAPPPPIPSGISVTAEIH